MPRKPKDENDQLAKAIGSRLDLAMQRRGFKIADLHKATGISRTVLLAYTRGTYAPGARELKLLCEHLDVSPTVLLFGSDEPKESPHRIGEVAVTSELTRIMAYLMLLARATPKEQAALLTIVEGLVEARDPQTHRKIIAVVRTVQESKEIQEAFASMSGMLEGLVGENAEALEAKVKAHLADPT